MRVHITRTEQYHEDLTPEQLRVMDESIMNVSLTVEEYRSALAAMVRASVDEWLEDVEPTVTVVVNVSDAEFRAYREREGQPLPLPGQIDIFGDEVTG